MTYLDNWVINDKPSLKTELIVTDKKFYQKVYPKVNLNLKTKGTMLLTQTEHVRWYVPLCLRRLKLFLSFLQPFTVYQNYYKGPKRLHKDCYLITS